MSTVAHLFAGSGGCTLEIGGLAQRRERFLPPPTAEAIAREVRGLARVGRDDRPVGPATLYARALQHPASVGSRAMASPMPAAPAGMRPDGV